MTKISKNIFIAYKTYSESCECVIILTDTLQEAEEKAKKHFNSIFVTVSKLTKTKEGIYIV